jgi:hypothetical protein
MPAWLIEDTYIGNTLCTLVFACVCAKSRFNSVPDQNRRDGSISGGWGDSDDDASSATACDAAEIGTAIVAVALEIGSPPDSPLQPPLAFVLP